MKKIKPPKPRKPTPQENLTNWLNQGRIQGEALGLRLALEAENKGLKVSDYIQADIRFRTLIGLQIPMSRTEIEEATKTLDRYATELEMGITLFTLWQDFDFGKIRINRFMEKRDINTEAINEGSIDWEDVLEVLTKRGAEFDFDKALIEESKERKRKWEMKN